MSRDETRDEVMRLLVDHGFWQDLGTVRCSRFASDVTDALAAPSPASPAETREGREWWIVVGMPREHVAVHGESLFDAVGEAVAQWVETHERDEWDPFVWSSDAATVAKAANENAALAAVVSSPASPAASPAVSLPGEAEAWPQALYDWLWDDRDVPAAVAAANARDWLRARLIAAASLPGEQPGGDER